MEYFRQEAHAGRRDRVVARHTDFKVEDITSCAGVGVGAGMGGICVNTRDHAKLVHITRFIRKHQQVYTCICAYTYHKMRMAGQEYSPPGKRIKTFKEEE